MQLSKVRQTDNNNGQFVWTREESIADSILLNLNFSALHSEGGVLTHYRQLFDNQVMSTYKSHRFPPDIISYAVWLYHRFNLSNRDVEDLLAERGINVRYETIRLWCIKFGTQYARRLKQRHRGYGDTLYLDDI